MREIIENAIEKRSLPAEPHLLLSPLLEEGKHYVSVEGPVWDFKQTWPFSYSDEYFGGIVRLICAFANSLGGIIIFGVHDQYRTAGHNKVLPNLDKSKKALSQILTGEVELDFRRYHQDTEQSVDVLLVNSLSTSQMPVRFSRRLGNYLPGIIWVRQGHEVVMAESKHVPMIYCHASAVAEFNERDSEVGGFLPPSPSTIGIFVGRLETIDRIFKWLKTSDEPRTFLFGKGGSGKTTIAYQVAKIIKASGAAVKLYGGERIDNVLFVSAKQSVIETLTGKQTRFVGLDFTNERELYEAILTYGNWTSRSLSELTVDQLKSELKDFLELTSNFIIIDDIDTLTTQGREAGFDFLYSALWRCRKKSKILYTLRNAPTQSLSNAIEVPGLDRKIQLDGGLTEYQKFVDVCVSQFRVQAPDSTIRDGILADISECRPLVLECIIAFRRTTGNYSQAIGLFEQGPGESIRDYVFQREWSMLPQNNFARYILAILSEYGSPLSFDDMLALSQYDEGRVKDALGEIREVFLKLNEVGDEMTYELGALTQSFVSTQAKKLNRYENIRERVKKYKANVYHENPTLTKLRTKIEGLIERGRRFDGNLVKQAWSEVSGNFYSASISEDPRFISIKGYVAAMQDPPRLDDARRGFENVFLMKYEPELLHLRAWYFAEKASEFGFENCIKIANFVAKGKSYSDLEKMDYLTKKGAAYFQRARDLTGIDPEKATQMYLEALRTHLTTYKKSQKMNYIGNVRFEEYCRNTAYVMFDLMVTNRDYENFFARVADICSFDDIILDPIELPLVRAFEIIEATRIPNKADAMRIRNRVENAKKKILTTAWDDRGGKDRVCDTVSDA